LFDRFYRGDPSRSHADRNHGLGLAIVAAIARMHGGRPLATSADGISSIGMSLKDGLAEYEIPVQATPAATVGVMPGP
jgi:two-component system heavy metal sensor histidine kinase CusS